MSKFGGEKRYADILTVLLVIVINGIVALLGYFGYTAIRERAIENELDFRTFFEWYRNQEDIENEYIRESGQQDYQDK